MSFVSGLLGGSKPKDYVIRPGEFADLYRQEREGNNPDVNSFWGSSTVDWDGDKATITQTMNPQLEGIANQLLGFVGQGPQQLGNYSNPFIEGLLGNTSQMMSGRMGMQSPQVNMGGYQQPQQQMPAPTVMPANQPTVSPPQLPAPVGGEQIGPIPAQGGGGYGVNPGFGMIQNFLNAQDHSQRTMPGDWQTRR